MRRAYSPRLYQLTQLLKAIKRLITKALITGSTILRGMTVRVIRVNSIQRIQNDRTQFCASTEKMTTRMMNEMIS